MHRAKRTATTMPTIHWIYNVICFWKFNHNNSDKTATNSRTNLVEERTHKTEPEKNDCWNHKNRFNEWMSGVCIWQAMGFGPLSPRGPVHNSLMCIRVAYMVQQTVSNGHATNYIRGFNYQRPPLYQWGSFFILSLLPLDQTFFYLFFTMVASPSRTSLPHSLSGLQVYGHG